MSHSPETNDRCFKIRIDESQSRNTVNSYLSLNSYQGRLNNRHFKLLKMLVQLGTQKSLKFKYLECQEAYQFFFSILTQRDITNNILN